MWSLKRRPGSLSLSLRLSQWDGSLAPRYLFYSEPSYTTYMAARRGMFISRFRGEARPMRARDVDRTETQTHTLIHTYQSGRMGTAHPGYTKVYARQMYAANVATAQRRARARVRVRQFVIGMIPEPPLSSFKLHLPPYPATCT